VGQGPAGRAEAGQSKRGRSIGRSWLQSGQLGQIPVGVWLEAIGGCRDSSGDQLQSLQCSASTCLRSGQCSVQLLGRSCGGCCLHLSAVCDSCSSRLSGGSCLQQVSCSVQLGVLAVFQPGSLASGQVRCRVGPVHGQSCRLDSRGVLCCGFERRAGCGRHDGGQGARMQSSLATHQGSGACMQLPVAGQRTVLRQAGQCQCWQYAACAQQLQVQVEVQSSACSPQLQPSKASPAHALPLTLLTPSA